MHERVGPSFVGSELFVCAVYTVLHMFYPILSCNGVRNIALISYENISELHNMPYVCCILKRICWNIY